MPAPSLGVQRTAFGHVGAPSKRRSAVAPPPLPPMDARKDSESPPAPAARDQPPVVPPDLLDPTLHIKYRVGDYLGKGGFAWCYEAIDDANGRTYALKVIAKSRLTKPTHREKVTREITLQSRCAHENVCRLHSAFEDDDNIYMVLEYCALKSLVNVVRQRGQLSEGEARQYLRQLLYAVSYLHDDVHVLHRDLKLGNMLVAADMTVKLADFGLATSMARPGRPLAISICGTPNYIAPEVLRKEGHSVASECWAIGCVLYAMLSGRPPFETENLEDTYREIQQCNYLLPTSFSPHARDLVQRLLHPNPSCRLTPDSILRHPFLTDQRAAIIQLKPDHCERAPFDWEWVAPGELLSTPLTAASFGRAPIAAIEALDEYGRNARTPSPSAHRRVQQPTGGRRKLRVPSSCAQEAVRTASTGSADSGIGMGSTSPPLLHDVGADLSVLFRWYQAMLNEEQLDLNRAAADNPFGGAAGYKRMSKTALSVGSAGLYIAKWIDYSNKNGFGCQLCDGTVSVMFCDQSVLCLSNDRRLYQYESGDGGHPFYWYSEDPPPELLVGKVSIMVNFTVYMDNHLQQAGGDAFGDFSRGPSPGPLPSIRFWKRFGTRTIFMCLSDGTVQVNHCESHKKVVLRRRALTGGGDELLVTLLDADSRTPRSMAVRARDAAGRAFGAPLDTHSDAAVLPDDVRRALADTLELLQLVVGPARVRPAPPPTSPAAPAFAASSLLVTDC